MLSIVVFKRPVLCAIVASASFFASSSPAQSTFGSFVGTVKDPSGTNFANSYDNGTGSSRPDTVPGVSVVPSGQNIQQWINPAAFAVPANNIGRFGDSPVGSVVGPGTQAVSLSLYRSFKYKERLALRLGVSSSNLFNHPNYGSPNLTLGTAPFGTISSLQSAEGAGPRGVQLGGRLTF